jgi:glycogen phosphorylase
MSGARAQSSAVRFRGVDGHRRHLVFNSVIDPAAGGLRGRFEAFAGSIRDALSQRWIDAEKAYSRANPKRIYYLSMEFLIGRTLANNLTNLGLGAIAKPTSISACG